MFQEYAEIYDSLYQAKDYPGECSFLEAVFAKFATSRKIKRILDVSVGTGGHSLILAKRGYQVEGSDYSTEMVELAKAKAKLAGQDIFLRGGVSMARLPPGKADFDAVMSVFASVNYLTKNGELQDFIGGAGSHLGKGGLLYFDFWNGIACLKEHPASRTKEVAWGDKRIRRSSTTTLDPMNDAATVNFDFTILEDGQVVKEFSEAHRLRYFFPRQIIEVAENFGFEVLELLPFKALDRVATETDWYISLVARKV